MLNQVILVGRLTKEVQINNSENGKKIAKITLAIPRSFKNMNGIYDTDFVDCILWDNTATNTAETTGNAAITIPPQSIIKPPYSTGRIMNLRYWSVSLSQRGHIPDTFSTS